MTLRNVVIGLCAGLVVVAGLQAIFGVIGWLPVAIYSAVLLVLFLFEFGRYRPKVDRSAGPWQPTDEKFEDPASGELLQVYVNAQTGERDYRPLRQPGAAADATAGRLA